MSDSSCLDTIIFVYSFDRGAAAIQAQCELLLPEDLQHGQKFAGVRIENPFQSPAS